MKFFRFSGCLAFIATSVMSMTINAAKPNLVLLPIDVSQVDADLESEYGTSLQDGLKQRYNVFYGAAVEKELEKEYSKLDCDAETCNQNIAIAFNGELLADSSVKKISGGYLLKLLIRNVITSEVIESKTYPCRRCDSFSVVDALKLLGANGVVQSQTAKLVVPVLPSARAESMIKNKPVVKPWNPSNVGFGDWGSGQSEILNTDLPLK